MVVGWPPCPNKAATLGPFRVPEDVKMTSAKYIEFLTDHFLPLYKKKNRAFHSKIIFMHDNAPLSCYAHKSRETHGVITILP